MTYLSLRALQKAQLLFHLRHVTAAQAWHKLSKARGKFWCFTERSGHFSKRKKQVLLSSQSLHSLPAVEEVNAHNLVFLVKIWLTGSYIKWTSAHLQQNNCLYCMTQFPLCMQALPPLASVSRAGGMAFLDSPVSVVMLRSRLDLIFSIPPMLLTDWLTAFSPGLHGEIWLALTPWLPAPAFFGPRWLVAPCCCWTCWFILGIWDRLSLVTCLPWLASLLSGCIWVAGKKLVENSCACLSVELTLLRADTDGEKKSIDLDDTDQWFRLKFCIGP